MIIYLAQPDIGPKEKQAVLDVLDSGIVASRPRVREFEQKFADYCNVDHAIAVSSGTTALHAALLGLGVGEGDGVCSPIGPLLSTFVSDSTYTTKDSSKQAHVKKMISSRLPICCFCMCSALKIFRYSHFCLVQADI